MSFNLNKLVQPECGAPNPLVSAAQQIAFRPSSSAPLSTIRAQQPMVNFSSEFVNQKLLNQCTSGAHQILPNVVLPSTSQIGNPMYHQSVPTNNIAINTNQQGVFAKDFLAEQDIQKMENMAIANQVPGRYQMDQIAFRVANHIAQQPVQASAGDQLETKYRNDMISQDADTQRVQTKEKVDDVAFWQNLSQKYIGPSTFGRVLQEIEVEKEESRSEQEVDVDAQIEDLFGEDIDETLVRERTPSPKVTDYPFDDRNPLRNQFDDPFTEGLKRLEQGDIPSAALLFEAAVEKEPNNALAWHYLGTTQAQNENDGAAIKALEMCIKLNPEDQQARLAISVSLANEVIHYRACKYLLEWLIRHDKYKSLGARMEDFYNLGDDMSTNNPFTSNLLVKKHYEYVRDKLMEAARLSPNNPDPEVQSSLGVLFNMRGHYDKAVDCFKAALSVQSEDALSWNRLGATLANGNKSDEAVVAYRKALELSPGFLRSRYNLAISLIHLNTYDEAAKQLVQILNMQAAGTGSSTTIRTRSVTSTSIWNTLRTVATLMNKPELYPLIDARDLAACNAEFLKPSKNN